MRFESFKCAFRSELPHVDFINGGIFRPFGMYKLDIFFWFIPCITNNRFFLFSATGRKKSHEHEEKRERKVFFHKNWLDSQRYKIALVFFVALSPVFAARALFFFRFGMQKANKMKRILITAIMALGCMTAVSAQGKGKFEIGFNTGLNMSSVSDQDYYEDSDTGYGFNLAASAEYYFSDSWGIKAKLIYDQKGWNDGLITDINSGDTYVTNYNLNYVTIPVMASWHFAPKRNWYLHFGPYVGFLASAKDTRFKADVKDDFATTDFGLEVGVGVKIPVTNKLKIFFEYDGQGGFSDIFKNNPNSEVTNSRSSLNIGINFLAN
jgi:opacity protein-like surface antigen